MEKEKADEMEMAAQKDEERETQEETEEIGRCKINLK